MPAINTKVDICNMALGHLGNRNTVTNIDTPRNDKETTFSLWYDITRQGLLKTLMPNFALARIIVSQKTAPAFGYAYAYEYPQRCLKMLGIGDIDCKGNVKYTVEDNLILTDQLYENGMPIRFIDDIKDVNAMSPEFVMTLSVELAKRVALSVTQDQGKLSAILKLLPAEMANTSGLNAQENPPIRKSSSRFRASRAVNVSDQHFKK